MKLLTAVNQYVNYRKSLGDAFETNHWKLKAFVHEVGSEVDLSEVKPDSVDKFLLGKTLTVTTTWHAKYYTLRDFYKYVISRGYIDSSPLPVVLPKQVQRLVPYIYSNEELKALFNACFSYKKRHYNRADPYMIHTLLLLLYGAGLRKSEALTLKLIDVDLNQSLLTIRETKFYKSRFVPIGEHLAQALQRYVIWRKQKRCSQDSESPFFIGRNGKAVTKAVIGDNFRLIRAKANIRRPKTDRYQPRIHDLRHTFAVHRLTTWYKEGADVQNLLPMLSVYLGHVTLAATSVYLTMTPALLEEAGHRFEQYTLQGDLR
jgi:integrase/recombinase XerD